MEFEIEVGGMITIQVTESFPIKANTLEEAKAEAIELFSKYLEDTYGYVDFDKDDIEIGYTGILKQ